MKLGTGIVIVALLLGACGSGGSAQGPGGRAEVKNGGAEPRGDMDERGSAADADQLYEFYGTVMDDADSGPELCVGGVALSLPPQCGGPPITNWDWDKVEGEEHELRRPGAPPPDEWEVSYGDYYVVGTYDGERFTMTRDPQRKPPPAPEEPIEDEFKTPCPEPEAGWTIADADMATMEHFERAAQAVRREPDHAVIWMDYIDGHSETAGNVILNAAFTGDLDRHEAEIREMWGGPLCVSRKPNAARELRRIRAELETEVLEEMGLVMVGSSSDGVSNMIEMQVIVFTPAQQRALDERYGEGKIRLGAELQPIDP